MIKLETFEPEDYKKLIGWIRSEKIMVHFSGKEFKYPITTEQLDNYTAVENRLIYKVIDSSTKEVIGHAGLDNIDKRNFSARICFVLIGDEDSRNKGYGKAIINELVRIGFEKLKLHRLDLGVYVSNIQAIICCESCGFEIEGKLKDVSKVHGAYWSLYNMSKINSEL